jgi:hypothetical protein
MVGKLGPSALRQCVSLFDRRLAPIGAPPAVAGHGYLGCGISIALSYRRADREQTRVLNFFKVSDDPGFGEIGRYCRSVFESSPSTPPLYLSSGLQRVTLPSIRTRADSQECRAAGVQHQAPNPLFSDRVRGCLQSAHIVAAPTLPRLSLQFLLPCRCDPPARCPPPGRRLFASRRARA